MTTGRLLGIARHGRPRGKIETADHVHVSIEGGLDGDFRGAVKPGGKGRRQVSLIRKDDWDAAMADLGATGIDWSLRRANLLVDGIDLFETAGTVVRIGSAVRLLITQECDPCSRMEEVAPGLKAALTPRWRGGALARVISSGDIRVGDTIEIEIGEA
jgi:MOSC domain-containing protein YiiM